MPCSRLCGVVRAILSKPNDCGRDKVPGLVLQTAVVNECLNQKDVIFRIVLLTALLPVPSVKARDLVYRHRRTPMSRFAYVRSVLVAVGVSMAAVYLGYWGLIGTRLWAY